MQGESSKGELPTTRRFNRRSAKARWIITPQPQEEEVRSAAIDKDVAFVRTPSSGDSSGRLRKSNGNIKRRPMTRHDGRGQSC